jgi:hypothetical protein
VRHRADRVLSRRVLAIAAAAVLLAGGVLWLVLAVLRPQEPAGAIDLRGWKLTLPVEGESGNAAIVEPAAVTEPWLTEGPDGSLTFWAPATGATTKNSDHPRTELDSLTNFSAATSGPHTLTASLAVSQVPADSKDIIVGQIHGAGDISSVPFVMLHYRDGEVRVVVKQQRSGQEAQSFSLLTGVALNERFDFTLSDTGDGTLVFSVGHAGTTQQVTAQVPNASRGATVRFQVGDYQQADTAQGPTDGGRVTFYRIDEQPSGS